MQFQDWLAAVKAALNEINMDPQDWQPRYPYDFAADYHAGLSPAESASKANTYWWNTQPRSLPHEDE